MTDETSSDTPGTEAGTAVADPIVTEEAGASTAVMTEEAPPDRLLQTVVIKEIGPCKKHITVTVERASIQHRLNAKYSELTIDSNVSGFRPGKAPRKIIEKRFEKDVSEQVKAELLLASLEQLAEEHDIAPLSAPKLDPYAILLPKEGPMVYEFEVEVRPQFDVPNYKGLKLRRPVRTFSDEDVAREERHLLAPYGQIVPKPEGNAQLGDIVIADIVSQYGSILLSDLKEISVRVDPQLAFKDGVALKFAEQMTGAGAGDTRTVDIQLSESTSDAGLRGKMVTGTFLSQCRRRLYRASRARVVSRPVPVWIPSAKVPPGPDAGSVTLI